MRLDEISYPQNSAQRITHGHINPRTHTHINENEMSYVEVLPRIPGIRTASERKHVLVAKIVSR